MVGAHGGQLCLWKYSGRREINNNDEHTTKEGCAIADSVVAIKSNKIWLCGAKKNLFSHHHMFSLPIQTLELLILTLFIRWGLHRPKGVLGHLNKTILKQTELGRGLWSKSTIINQSHTRLHNYSFPYILFPAHFAEEGLQWYCISAKASQHSSTKLITMQVLVYAWNADWGEKKWHSPSMRHTKSKAKKWWQCQDVCSRPWGLTDRLSQKKKKKKRVGVGIVQRP